MVLVCQGFCDKEQQSKWLKQQKLTVIQFWRLANFARFPVLYNSLEGWGGVGGGRGSRRTGHMYTNGWTMLMYGRIQHNIVKQLYFNLKWILKRKWEIKIIFFMVSISGPSIFSLNHSSIMSYLLWVPSSVFFIWDIAVFITRSYTIVFYNFHVSNFQTYRKQ